MRRRGVWECGHRFHQILIFLFLLSLSPSLNFPYFPYFSQFLSILLPFLVYPYLRYGQTGSGKTHTMVGRTNDPAGVEQGLLPRTFREIFAIQSRDCATYTFETTIQVAELCVGRVALEGG